MAAEHGVGEKSNRIKIFVVLPRPGTLMNPNTISLEVSSSDTVANLKARLEGIDAGTKYVSPIPPRRQCLVLAGAALPDEDDGKTLANHGMGNSSTVHLVETQMSVYVRDPRCTRTLCGLSSTDTVESLKDSCQKSGSPGSRNGVRVEDRHHKE